MHKSFINLYTCVYIYMMEEILGGELFLNTVEYDRFLLLVDTSRGPPGLANPLRKNILQLMAHLTVDGTSYSWWNILQLIGCFPCQRVTARFPKHQSYFNVYSSNSSCRILLLYLFHPSTFRLVSNHLPNFSPIPFTSQPIKNESCCCFSKHVFKRHMFSSKKNGANLPSLLTRPMFYPPTWRIIPGLASGDRITPIYKPWSSAIWKGSHNPILRGLTLPETNITPENGWLEY